MFEHAPFAFAEVSIPFGAIGSFGFPFILFNTMWVTLAKLPKRGESSEQVGPR